jgi:hypothetical protein
MNKIKRVNISVFFTIILLPIMVFVLCNCSGGKTDSNVSTTSSDNVSGTSSDGGSSVSSTESDVTASNTSSEEVLEMPNGVDFVYKELGRIPAGQDGAIYGNYIFRFESDGTCKVVTLDKLEVIASFTLDRIDQIKPHSNAVCFSNVKYDEADEFPLLYSNVYNNYASDKTDRREGMCCV